MSNEHFQTFLTADMRTALNGRDVDYAESNTQEPRSFVSKASLLVEPMEQALRDFRVAVGAKPYDVEEIRRRWEVYEAAQIEFLDAQGQLAFNPAVEGNRGRAWSSGYLYAHNAMELCARTVERDEMSGLTGDHPEKRAQAAVIIRAVADLVKELAADAACDGHINDADWNTALAAVRAATHEPRPVPA